jgi:hypothetical protein
MAWLLGLVIVGGLVYLAYSSPEVRKAVIIVLAVVLCGIAYLLYDEYSTEEQATSLIAVDQVELRDFATNTRTGIFYAKGSIKNLSAENTLASLQLRVRAHDCPSETLSDACETVGESVEKIKLEIPPGQVRGVEKSVSFSNLPAVTNLVWSFDVVGVRAKVD